MRATSLFLIATGAILTFAVNLFVDGVDLRAVGIILMIVGVLGIAIGFARDGASTKVHRQVSPDGTSMVEHRHTTGV